MSPLNFSIVGAGPAGFYTAKYLFKYFSNISVTFFDALPTPFGLVRGGVAPDHPETKNVILDFTKILNQKNCNFLGNVKYGKDIHLNDLQKNFDATIFAYGAAKDKKLNIEGEFLKGIYPARDFIDYYNSFNSRIKTFGLNKVQNVLIIGNGNVALDCARILSQKTSILRKTEISKRALNDLENSAISNIFIAGRRGIFDSKFSIKELKEIFNIESNFLSANFEIDKNFNFENFDLIQKRIAKKKLEFFKKISDKNRNEISSIIKLKSNKNINFLFNSKPVKFENFKNNAINAIFNNNGNEISIKANLIFKAIGFYSAKAEGLPFDENLKIIPNKNGRILGENRIYVSGWLKSGPSGLILNTIADARDTAESIRNDFEEFKNNNMENLNQNIKNNFNFKGYSLIKNKLCKKGIKFVDKEGWFRIDNEEKRRGKQLLKERDKIDDLEEAIRIARNENK